MKHNSKKNGCFQPRCRRYTHCLAGACAVFWSVGCEAQARPYSSVEVLCLPISWLVCTLQLDNTAVRGVRACFFPADALAHADDREATSRGTAVRLYQCHSAPPRHYRRTTTAQRNQQRNVLFGHGQRVRRLCGNTLFRILGANSKGCSSPRMLNSVSAGCVETSRLFPVNPSGYVIPWRQAKRSLRAVCVARRCHNTSLQGRHVLSLFDSILAHAVIFV